MTRLISIFLIAILTAVAGTTVSQTVVGPDGLPANGQALIRISAACRSGSDYVGDRTIQVKFTGTFSVNLVPNDTCRPSGTSYTVSWLLTGGRTWTETWVVPTRTTPITVDAVVTSQSSAPSYMIQWQQLTQNGATVGQGPVWNGSAWVPGYVTAEATWGAIAGLMGDQSDLAAALGAKESTANKGQAGGYAPLDSGSKLPVANLPSSVPRVYGSSADGSYLRFSSSDGQYHAVTFVDQETPVGAVDGSNREFALAGAPVPLSGLVLFRNGIVQKRGFDYDLDGNTITFVEAATPQDGDTIIAWYRY